MSKFHTILFIAACTVVGFLMAMTPSTSAHKSADGALHALYNSWFYQEQLECQLAPDGNIVATKSVGPFWHREIWKYRVDKNRRLGEVFHGEYMFSVYSDPVQFILRQTMYHKDADGRYRETDAGLELESRYAFAGMRIADEVVHYLPICAPHVHY